MRVLTLGLMHLKQSFSGESIRNYHEIMAGALISILPVLVMFAIFQKQMLSGYTKAAIEVTGAKAKSGRTTQNA